MSRLLVLVLVALLGACSNAPRTAKMVKPAIPTLHNHWVLFAIDGKKVPQVKPAQVLNIDSKYRVEGLAGCNRIFGQGALKNQQLIFENLSTTMMLCPRELDHYETSIVDVLSNEPRVTMYRGDLVLRANHRVLQYRLVPDSQTE